MTKISITDKAKTIMARNDTDEVKAIVMAVIFDQAAHIISARTGVDADMILALITTLVDVGLVKQPSYAMDKLLELTDGERKSVRFNLLRDKLVLGLSKDGLIDEEKATAWLGGLDAENN